MVVIKIMTFYVIIELLKFVMHIIEYYLKCYVKRENDDKFFS